MTDDRLQWEQQQQNETVTMLKGMAEAAAQTDSKRCIEGEPMLYFPYHRALVPGHIYSEGGIREARISGCCEYHFDRMFEPGWVDVVTGQPGLTSAEEE